MSGAEASLEQMLSVVDRAIRDADEPPAGHDSQVGSHGLRVYRKLVRRGLAANVRVEMPRTAARLGPRFDELVDAFVSERAPRSRYLRDVAFEFLAFATPRLAADPAVPPHLVDLARHELSAFASGSAPDAQPGTRGPLELGRTAAFDPSVRLERYEHAVHELSADEDARDEPRQAETWLLVYRDRDDEVRYLSLTPLAAAVVERLRDGATLEGAIREACSAAGRAMDDAVLAGTATVLSDLASRGALLGAGETST